ncbi:MAG: hypothetical protein EXX96DRAFT_605316 [Benjaminiella poitrasii]|nr:MAG: hypothetical protein EXX96DRAFT_605316 [Benjaminiella poitrasii]
MTKRKVSCLRCRTKKIKCDGEKPCNRCQMKQIDCVYQKPRAVGRPPKNAIINKLTISQFTINDSNSEKHSSIIPDQNTNSTIVCREFIFENASFKPIDSALQLQNFNRYELAYYIDSIFSIYFPKSILDQAIVGESNTSLINRDRSSKINLRIKTFDLLQQFAWFSADTAAILMRRISNLHMSLYSELEFSNVIFNDDLTTQFFEHPLNSPLININPLNSLPPQQAIRLIDCFFSIHPYSFILNKTMLLKSYWSDTADPLLLSVVYGTTIFKSQILEGKPLELWDGLYNKKKRNPFLEYAYFLLSKSTGDVTPSKYQAVALLALFEVVFGLPKKGAVLFGTLSLLASKLGLFDKTAFLEVDSVEKELLLVTFWSSFEFSMRGSVEFEKIPKMLFIQHNHPYPPCNINSSKSYQYDIRNNNPRLSKSQSYIVESFYIKTVVSRIASNLLVHLPHIPSVTISKSPPIIHQLFKGLKYISPDIQKQHTITIEKRIDMVLDDFKEFIENNKEDWSSFQAYTLTLFHSFFRICLVFLRDTVLNPNKTNQHPFSMKDYYASSKLDLTDTNNALAVINAIPESINVVETCLQFLSDSNNYFHKPNLLHHGIIAYAIDAASQVLMYAYQLEKSKKIRYYLEMTIVVLEIPIIWDDWKINEMLKITIQKFLRDISSSENTNNICNDNSKPYNATFPFTFSTSEQDYNNSFDPTQFMTSLLPLHEIPTVPFQLSTLSYNSNSCLTNDDESWTQNANDINFASIPLETLLQLDYDHTC